MSCRARPVLSPGYARYALTVLFAVNLFNYVDRQIISGVLSLVRRDLELTDAALGALGSAFMILYLLGSIPLGLLGDRIRRNRLIAVGVAVWGVATFLSGLAASYAQLFVSRALVGIGEASYGPTASAMVSDLFPKSRRGLVNSVFTAAIPVGGAIGVVVGGVVGSRFGWRAAFLLVGVPSVVLAFLAWRLVDPPRGGHDRPAGARSLPVREVRPVPLAVGIATLFRTPTFVMVCSVGMLVAFAIGAFNHWLPLYLERVKRFTTMEASSWVGGLSASGGVLGMLIGGALGDALTRRTAAGHLLTIGGGFIASAPFALLFLRSTRPAIFLPALFFAILFLVLYTGTVNALIHNVVPPTLRATALAFFVSLVTLGGAAPSPFVVGVISGRRSLQAAMSLLPFMLFFAGVIALAAATVVATDMRRIERGLTVVSSGQLPDG